MDLISISVDLDLKVLGRPTIKRIVNSGKAAIVQTGVISRTAVSVGTAAQLMKEGIKRRSTRFFEQSRFRVDRFYTAEIVTGTSGNRPAFDSDRLKYSLPFDLSD